MLCWIREKLRAHGDLRAWKTVRRLLCTHSIVTTVLPLNDGRVMHIRKASRADAEQQLIDNELGLDWKNAFKPITNP